jgi:hypothetical protein
VSHGFTAKGFPKSAGAVCDQTLPQELASHMATPALDCESAEHEVSHAFTAKGFPKSAGAVCDQTLLQELASHMATPALDCESAEHEVSHAFTAKGLSNLPEQCVTKYFLKTR